VRNVEILWTVVTLAFVLGVIGVVLFAGMRIFLVGWHEEQLR
jgi:hypothetical protein